MTPEMKRALSDQRARQQESEMERKASSRRMKGEQSRRDRIEFKEEEGE